MKLKIDKETNTLYLRLDESRIVDSEEVKPGVILDYDENENVVGIEILNVRGRVPEEYLQNLLFETA
jgi:uncharacterized protein YuzE